MSARTELHAALLGGVWTRGYGTTPQQEADKLIEAYRAEVLAEVVPAPQLEADGTCAVSKCGPCSFQRAIPRPGYRCARLATPQQVPAPVGDGSCCYHGCLIGGGECPGCDNEAAAVRAQRGGAS